MANTDIPVTQSWALIERLTETMQQAALEHDWPHVLELATQRHQYLMAHFDKFPVGPDNAEFYHQHLHAMLTGEQQLQAITTEARKAVMRDSLVSSRNHRAVGAYLAN